MVRSEGKEQPLISTRRRPIGWWLGQWQVPVLILTIVLMMVPFYFAVVISGKTYSQYEYNPIGITTPFYFSQTYSAAWRVVSRYILNSIIVSSVSCMGVLVLGAISAYVFARFEFLGRESLFVVVLALLMIPGVLTLVPRFVLMYQLGVFQTIWALLLPYIALGQVMAIFLLRTFFASIPGDYFESARIDGASEARCFWHIALPLSQPVFGVVAVLQILGTWNDLFWPYLMVGMKQQLFTIPVGLLIFTNNYGTQTQIGTQMAGYVLASLPLVILFAFISRLFVEGLAAGGLKL